MTSSALGPALGEYTHMQYQCVHVHDLPLAQLLAGNHILVPRVSCTTHVFVVSTVSNADASSFYIRRIYLGTDSLCSP